MNLIIARLLFEHSPFTPFWSAFSVGFCAIAPDGTVYLTRRGEAYLESLA